MNFGSWYDMKNWSTESLKGIVYKTATPPHPYSKDVLRVILNAGQSAAPHLATILSSQIQENVITSREDDLILLLGELAPQEAIPICKQILRNPNYYDQAYQAASEVLAEHGHLDWLCKILLDVSSKVAIRYSVAVELYYQATRTMDAWEKVTRCFRQALSEIIELVRKNPETDWDYEWLGQTLMYSLTKLGDQQSDDVVEEASSLSYILSCIYIEDLVVMKPVPLNGKSPARPHWLERE
jgi:hypothetical protein